MPSFGGASQKPPAIECKFGCGGCMVWTKQSHSVQKSTTKTGCVHDAGKAHGNIVLLRIYAIRLP